MRLDRKRLLADAVRPGQRVFQATNDACSRIVLGYFAEQHEKLVTRQTRERVALPQSLLQPVRDRAQHRITRRAAETLIQGAQPVDVDMRQSGRLAVPSRE